jgi:tetratricopeptide repeat protein
MRVGARIAARLTLLLVALLGLDSGCALRKQPVHPELTTAGDRHDALALSDALEALIDAGQDTLADREYAYDIVHAQTDDTAPSLFARAAVTGRLVQRKGLRAANLVPEIERCARRSRELDPSFRAGAATRLLGTLYVMAPAVLLHSGDSELGVELLEGLVQQYPRDYENHLRLAEAYIALGDPASANAHLCACLAHKAALRRDDQRLLDQLIDNAGPPACEQTTAVPPAPLG